MIQCPLDAKLTKLILDDKAIIMIDEMTGNHFDYQNVSLSYTKIEKNTFITTIQIEVMSLLTLPLDSKFNTNDGTMLPAI